MTDKVQKIREEIERVKTIHSSVSLKNSKPDRLAVQVCINLLSFIDSLQEEYVTKDLEETAEEYTKDDILKPWRNLCKGSFISGAMWQKEQMMKDAVEASVNTYEEIGGEGYVEFVANVPIGKYKEKDVVKIITI